MSLVVHIDATLRHATAYLGLARPARNCQTGNGSTTAAGTSATAQGKHGVEFEPGFGDGLRRPPPPPRAPTGLHPGKGKGLEREEEQESGSLRLVL